MDNRLGDFPYYLPAPHGIAFGLTRCACRKVNLLYGEAINKETINLSSEEIQRLNYSAHAIENLQGADICADLKRKWYGYDLI